MEPSPPLTEVILTYPQQSLGKVPLDGTLQPGAYLELEGKTYAVLERRHRYQFKAGRYRLHQISLYVQKAQQPAEKSWMDGRWVIGDATCQLNAQSELIRCAVNPDGPCAGCRYYEPRKNQG
jgi:hypothetical protein